MNAPTRELKAKIWERGDLDWYQEPPAASKALFEVERFNGAIWDPACGAGSIMESAIAADYTAVGSDIKRRTQSAWFHSERDFLKLEYGLGQNIVVNPPYFGSKGAEAFIRKALVLAKGKVAAFLDMRFLSGAKRAEGLFAEFPPHRIWLLTPRVSCPPGEFLEAGNKAGGGTADYCWCVWSLLEPPPRCSELRWLLGVGKSKGGEKT